MSNDDQDKISSQAQFFNNLAQRKPLLKAHLNLVMGDNIIYDEVDVMSVQLSQYSEWLEDMLLVKKNHQTYEYLKAQVLDWSKKRFGSLPVKFDKKSILSGEFIVIVELEKKYDDNNLFQEKYCYSSGLFVFGFTGAFNLLEMNLLNSISSHTFKTWPLKGWSP